MVKEKPIIRETQIETQKEIVAYTGDPVFRNASYRCCPHCNSSNSKKNGKDGKGRIRWLCECKKSFVVNWKVWNLDKLFSDFFEEGFTNARRASSIQCKGRIHRKLLSDKEIQQYIDSSIIETTLDKSYSDDEKDRYTFIKACIMADKKDSEEASQVHDSWYFLLNTYNSDVTYVLDHYCYILIRKYNFDFSKRQNLQKPLLTCDKCGTSDLSTHGFNNNAKRRIKCNLCKKISIIRVSNLISQFEFASLCEMYLQDYTKDKDLIASITETLQYNFAFLSKSKAFDGLMARQAVITYNLKEQIFKAFIGLELIRRYKTVDQSTLNLLTGDSYLGSKINREGYLKVSDGTLYPWSPKNIDDILRINYAKSEEEYKFKNVECELAAHLHNVNSDTFYDWKSRSSVTFDQLL